MHENKWSPFDPEWYQEAFDRFISTADMLFNQQAIVEAGYDLPDVDGSRSSVFRSQAVLNNSFDEKILRETLKDIYLNSSHRLKASNHDTVHFMRWEGTLSEMTHNIGMNRYEFRLPWNLFIYQKERDAFKLSQFYRKWIKVEELLKNWKLFKWHLLVFIDRKVFSEYKLYIDEQEVLLRFPYVDYWAKQNFPIYIYKLDTNFQDRVKISRELMLNQWDWKVPIDCVAEGVKNHSKVVVAFNKLADPNHRTDGQTRIELLGDNIEFLDVVDGQIDLSTISKKNRIYIESELREWLWMTIFVPKFFHEYPVLLPVDTVHRPYIPELYRVMTLQGVTNQYVKSYNDENEESMRDVYIDMKGKILEPQPDNWHQMIRPLVLSDAYEAPEIEPYDSLFEEFRGIRDTSVNAASIVEDFNLYLKYETITDENWKLQVDSFMTIIQEMSDAYSAFYTKRRANLNRVFVNLFEGKFKPIIDALYEEGIESEWLYSTDERPETVLTIASQMINIVRELVERYYTIEILRGMRKRHIWNDPKEFVGKVRFQRPIDANDFWVFEYDIDDRVWRPAPSMKVSHQFPDVYLFNRGEEATPNRIYKAFIFYSDTMDVINEAREIDRATPMWDEDVMNFHVEQGAVYRDLFMEKFYWMAIRAIYKGILMTDQRWEVLEYVIDNESYQRFNDLFLQTMDPYFKLGLATYLKSANFEFPFDDAIHKFQEAANIDWNGYRKITNFEAYLNKQWTPSYFDHLQKILDGWRWEERYIARPPASFDVLRLLPVLRDVQEQMIDRTRETLNDLDWIIDQLAIEHYNLKVDALELLRSDIKRLLSNMERLLKFIIDLDLEIYSIGDLQYIISQIELYGGLMESIRALMATIRKDIDRNNVYLEKRGDLEEAYGHVIELKPRLDEIMNVMEEFDIEGFMKTVNDLRSYFDHAKTNPEDISILGQINQFDDHWSTLVKDARKVFFKSSALLYSLYDPAKAYTDEEVEGFVGQIEQVKADMIKLQEMTEWFWKNRELKRDQELIDRFDNGITLVDNFLQNILKYFDLRNQLKGVIDEIKRIHRSLDRLQIGKTEIGYRSEIGLQLDKMLSAVSYIVGDNKREEANEALQNVHSVCREWFLYVNHEEKVFERLIKVTDTDGIFLKITFEAWLWLLSITKYLSVVIENFEPDLRWPTYAEVFEATKIEIFNGGFRHAVGDTVYIQHLGSYRVIGITGETSIIELIEPDQRRRTQFRDPTSQLRPYDSITDGNGIGFMVKAVEVKTTPIINDTVVLPFITRIEKTMERIEQFILNPNPFNNREFTTVLSSVSKVYEDWAKIVKSYDSYMTQETRIRMTEVIINFQKIILQSETFIDLRSQVDLREFGQDWEQLIIDIAIHATSIGWNDEEFFYHDGEARTSYYELMTFLGTGTLWNDATRYAELIDSSREALFLYTKYILPRFDGGDEKVIAFKEKISLFEKKLIDVKFDLLSLPSFAATVQTVIDSTRALLDRIDPLELHKDLWHRITNVRVALPGEGYAVGDIVALVPELPTDINGQLFWEVKEFLFDRETLPPEGGLNRAVVNIELAHGREILNDDILVRVLRIDEDGAVIDVEIFMDYATPYLINGIRETRTLVGKGTGLLLDVFGVELTINDNTIISGEEVFIKPTNRFNENDLFTFKFENIHDLDMNYEVFLGGKQVQHFIQRHQQRFDKDENVLHPRKMDVIYLRANDVMDLAGSAIFFPSENYFVYRVNRIEVKDPGAGYSVGQDIFVDAGSFALRLKVTKLMMDPFKGIEALEPISGNLNFNEEDPTIIDGKVATDSLNNIDDEFNVGYYDRLPREGLLKAATLSLPKEDYPFLSKRFDSLDGDNRNDKIIYPFVQKHEGDPEGDPDYFWYAGNRIDNSEDPREVFGKEIVVTRFDPMVRDTISKLNWYMKSFKTETPVIPPEGGFAHFKAEVDYEEIHTPVGEARDGSVLPWTGGLVGFQIDLNWELVGRDHPLYQGILDRWNGIYELQPPTDPFIPTAMRLPPNLPPQGEYQRFEWMRFHNTRFEQEVHAKGIRVYPNHLNAEGGTVSAYIDFNLEEVVVEQSDSRTGVLIQVSPGRTVEIEYDLKVATHADLPKHSQQWSDAGIGKYVLVEADETNGGHRMLYRLRTFVARGYFVYNWPIIADRDWYHLDVNWMETDWYPDKPQLSQLYPTAPWREATSFRQLEEEISDGRHEAFIPPLQMNQTSYIHDITLEDLSIFNWTLKQWEDLDDGKAWRLETKNDPEKGEWGFRLTCLKKETYSHDLRLYWNKIPASQNRNAALKRDAVLDVYSLIGDEINIAARHIPVNTLRHLRIRKLFPYEQKQCFTIGFDKEKNPLGYEMNFKLTNYMHFKNQIQLQDIKVYNRTAGRFEDILDPKLFEVRFKDPKATSKGFEKQTRIVQSLLANSGEGFIDGEVWGWNATYGIHLFGSITATVGGAGFITSFTPRHCPNPPTEDLSLEFQLYQNEDQGPAQMGVVLVEFKTEEVELFGDGYLHNVINPFAPVPEEFKLIAQYDLDGPYEYDVIISKTAKKHTFIDPRWIITPTIKIPGMSLSHNSIYLMTDKGRFPLVNPSTGIPSHYTRQTEEGTEVVFLNLYRRYEHLEVRTVPYSMRSVYVQRRIPKHGFIDLAGKLNKPLNKKYFEFWVNGRLLHDEVTIITPTKLVMHGLRSLRNFEIIEVNRDPNEFFSDIFLEQRPNEIFRPTRAWDYSTYLDAALDGTLEGDNYTPEEQAYLLSPVWPQVPEDHPAYKDYPVNMDLDDDVILRVQIPNDLPIYDLDDTSSQFMMIDLPILEGRVFSGTMRFDQFGFRPIDNEMIVDLLNEEWKEEIATDPYLHPHVVISDDEWYGTTARLYDEYGILVHNLSEAAYKVPDWGVLGINTKRKTSKITPNPRAYDLN